MMLLAFTFTLNSKVIFPSNMQIIGNMNSFQEVTAAFYGAINCGVTRWVHSLPPLHGQS